MLNYEVFLEEINETQKEVSGLLKDAQKQEKTIEKASLTGDLKTVDKNIELLQKTIEELKDAYGVMAEKIDGFDRFAYVQKGEYAKQIIAECKKRDIDVRQDAKVLEMFPNKVTISDDTLDVSIDKKRQQILRPKALVDNIEKIQEKLSKSNFNAEKFLDEFYEGYENVLRKSKKKDTWVKLSDIYKAMVPMARLKKEYDLQAYAYDLSRLYTSDVEMTKDGKLIEWGVSRSVKDPIRILNENGVEELLCKVRFSDSQL